MTRVNVVPVTELCDQHLLAEHREITRIPNFVCKNDGQVKLPDVNATYCLGTGHVVFFRDKLGWLFDRYDDLYNECVRRGFNVSYNWPEDSLDYPELFKYFDVRDVDLELNRQRIAERMPVKPRFTKVIL